MKRLISAALAAFALAQATPALAQVSGARVHSILVPAVDLERLAKFYSEAFGMWETDRPMNTETYKEIMLKFGSTREEAKASISSAIIIVTKPDKAPPPSMATLVIDAPDLNKTIAAVVAAGGKGGKVETYGIHTYAMVADPEGNRIELVLRR